VLFRSIVHAGEWVAPAPMLNSPQYGPIIQALEQARVNGLPGYSNGGPSTSLGTNGNNSGNSSALISTDPELKYILKSVGRLLNELNTKGVKNQWPWQDVDNMRKGMTKLEDIEGEVTR
jgi:hypothetical protein